MRQFQVREKHLYFSKSRLFTPTYEIGAAKRNTMASLSESRSQTTNDLLELTANYDKTIAEIHNLSLLLGLSQEENKYEDLSASGSDFENNSMSLMGHAKSNYSVVVVHTAKERTEGTAGLGTTYRIVTFSMSHQAHTVILKIRTGST